MATFAKRLFDFYPAQDVGDPRVVMAGVVELFENYPPEVVLKAISPVFGIPGKFKFLPRIAEIKQVLDELSPKAPPPRVYPVFEQLPAPDRTQRPTYEQLIAKCAEAGLVIGKPRPRMLETEIAKFRADNGISAEQWDAIPNAK